MAFYLVSHFFGRSLMYKHELLKLSQPEGDYRLLSADVFKAFLAAHKIVVPSDKMPSIARYYAPLGLHRSPSMFSDNPGGGPDKVGGTAQACRRGGD